MGATNNSLNKPLFFSDQEAFISLLKLNLHEFFFLHQRCVICWSNWHFRSLVVFQDVRNQMITTNVWVRQVSICKFRLTFTSWFVHSFPNSLIYSPAQPTLHIFSNLPEQKHYSFISETKSFSRRLQRVRHVHRTWINFLINIFTVGRFGTTSFSRGTLGIMIKFRRSGWTHP